jgi:hypothetical protein
VTGTIAFPYRFDTSDVWRTIIKGAFGMNALLVVCILLAVLGSREWTAVLGLVVSELLVLGFTRVFVRFQTGSAGALWPDRVEIEPNVLLGLSLPGPKGTYTLDRFSAVRVEFRPGSVTAEANSAGPHELVWLAGRPGTPDVVLARTQNGAGRDVGRELGAALRMPVEEVGAPKVIRL